jgi:predicted transcriptional regulator
MRIISGLRGRTTSVAPLNSSRIFGRRWIGFYGKEYPSMKILRVGIASYQEMKARTLAVARGERRVSPSDPKIWFTSAESFARILSEPNRSLLRVIAKSRPGSLAELAELTGRHKSNLSRTLKTMERYGLVSLERGPRGVLIPKAPYECIELLLPITSPGEAA